jgi:hypothetical protein
VQEFSKLPKPCLFKVSAAADKPDYGATLAWLLQYGAGCERYEDRGPVNIDQVQPPNLTNEPGYVIHWNENFKAGEQIAHFLDSSAFKVRISHQLPPQSPANLIWIDIGPGSPLKLN